MKKRQFITLIAVSLIMTGPALFASGQHEKGGEDQNPSVQSSIQTSGADPAKFTDQVISIDQAAASAKEAAGSGVTVLAVSLDDENGSLVYSVQLSDSTMAILDAGNGSVLYKGKDVEERDGNEDNGKEGNEGEEE